MNYAGIGSRKTPGEMLEAMEKIGRALAYKGCILRSGGAKGADSAFERGCDIAKGRKKIFLPWKGFEGSSSKLVLTEFTNYKEAEALARRYHPNYEALSQGAKKLMARNGYQVLGVDLQTPADFIVCYTENGEIKGGTGQALRMAADYGIPVFNLGNYKSKEEVFDAFNDFYNKQRAKHEQEMESDSLER